MSNPLVRIFQRYFVPRFVTSLYYFFRYRAFISLQAKVQLTGKIRFGKGTVVKSFAVIQTGKGQIVFGSNCAVSSFDHISTSDAEVRIGDNVRIGSNVVILGSRRNFADRNSLIVDQGYTHTGTKIGDDVLVGAGAVILDGSEIGDGAVIGAGSVVTKSVEPYSVVAGIPARRVGERS